MQPAKRVDFAYNAASQFEQITRYTDLSGSEFVANTFFSYDGLGRLKSLLHTEDATAPSSGWGTDPLAGYQFAYDVASRITAIDSYVDGLTEYDYDATSQLIGANHTGQTDEAYSYDENGNRTMSGYATTDNNRLTSDGTYNYTYDDEGNRLTKTAISTGEKEEYAWDHRNRLDSVTFKNSGGTVTKTVDFVYDAFDRLIRRTIDPDGATGSAALVDSFFSWEDNQINLEFDGSSASDLVSRYLWNPAAIDQILAVENVSSLLSGGDVVWPLTDHLGTPRDLASYDSGTGVTTIENHRVFESFGQLTSETNASFTIAIGFTGVLFDITTGLGYHRHRWLDLHTGRWMSEDPIGFIGQDPNLLRFVANSPTHFVDPDGLQVAVPQTGTVPVPVELPGVKAPTAAQVGSAAKVAAKVGNTAAGPFNGIAINVGLRGKAIAEQLQKAIEQGKVDCETAAEIEAKLNGLSIVSTRLRWDPTELLGKFRTVELLNLTGGVGSRRRPE